MKHIIRKLKNFSVAILCCTGMHVYAQDSLHISLPEAEKQFVQKNLGLLAEKYNIDIAKAAVIQARLFNNPSMVVSGNLYDPKENRIFNVSNTTGQYDVAVQQLIRLAHKRNKEIALAQINTSMSEDRYYELLRTLRFSLRSNFFDLYYTQQTINGYQRQIDALQRLNAAYEDLQTKGVVTDKDALRIKSLLYSLTSERAVLQNQLIDLQSSFQLLLQNNKTWFIADIAHHQLPELNNLNLPGLIDTAFANRHDLKLAENDLRSVNTNYLLQKALAKPDITLGAEFDKRGSFVDNASFLTIGIDLPFFNRNQGNIKAAKISIDQGKARLDQQKQEVENDVQRAYSKLLSADKVLRSMDPKFQEKFEHLLLGITENFEKRNISLVEFTDFCESYKNNVLQFNQLQDQRAQAIEALHFAIGKTMFNN